MATVEIERDAHLRESGQSPGIPAVDACFDMHLQEARPVRAMIADTEKIGKSFGLKSLAIFIVAVGAMAVFRLIVFPAEFLTLSYALPLLICWWHRDLRLLWAMAVTFVVMALLKVVYYGPDPHGLTAWDLAQGAMHVINILTVALVVHAIIRLTARIEKQNEELTARAEEISRQNDELQQQAEELAQQNEEIHAQAEEFNRQNEELNQQSEELHAQTDELQTTNAELAEREVMLQTLIECARAQGSDRDFLDRICQSVVKLCGDRAAGAAVVEKHGTELVVRACHGIEVSREHQWPFDKSLTAIVMQERRTAFIENIAKRPDIILPPGTNVRFQSVIAAPLYIDGIAAGAVTAYSPEPQQWTTRDFELLEWVGAQCAFILEARRLREAMAEANANLEKTVKTRTVEMQELINELEHFSYTITHDMRAPLRAMQGFATILKEDHPDLPVDASEHLDNIINSARRMDRLITDALSYNKAVRQEVAAVPVDVRKLVNEMLPSYPLFQMPHARIEIAENLPRVLANEAGLTQCVSNILDNAIKFAKPGEQPRVRIWSENDKGVARIWFEDNGIGIPDDFKPRVFDMFQRASKTHEGTGIGLALVRKVVERMGGKAGCESQVGEGTRFWLELKRCS
jgi:signal transduction histidine kinase